MKYFFLTLFILLAGIVLSQLFVANNTAKTERIKYSVLKKYDGFEIRKYSEKTVASTQLNKSSYSQMSSQGFRKIAGYIFGGNSESKQIAMTSPVKMEMGGNATMSFYMPEGFSEKNLPEPNSKDVLIKTEPEKIVAAISFSGWASDEVLIEKFNELKSLLESKGINYKNDFSYLGYNPPYQMIDRKNEVLIELIEYHEN